MVQFDREHGYVRLSAFKFVDMYTIIAHLAQKGASYRKRIDHM